MNIFDSDEDRRVYLTFLQEEAERSGMDILAWCLMTNHVHFVAVPYSETSLARGFGETHRRYTRMKNFIQGVRGYLFQGRFSSSVLDEAHLLAAVLNPVRAGMVACAWDHPWSSAAFHSGRAEVDTLVTDRTLLGLITDWDDYLACGMAEEIDRIRMATQTGRPAGDEAFVDKVADATGRDLSKGKAGRPKKQ